MTRNQPVIGFVAAAVLAATACAERVTPADARGVAARDDALARAQVFRAPVAPALLQPSALGQGDVTCRYVPSVPTGTTPKFDCELPDGTRVKVKYGDTPEIPGEMAGTRLLAALGFGADYVAIAPSLRCYGCPVSPFHVRRLARWFRLDPLFGRARDEATSREFKWVAVERKLDGDAIDAGGRKGWGFYELKRIDPGRGGASRADVDALRLVAVFLAHWDNKDANQRLVCLPPGEDVDRCRRPLVMLQDLGATFGPRKVNLAAWRATQVWADAETCTVSMSGLPHGGGTFEDVQITEAGRRALADRLTRLQPEHVATLFTHARFPGDVQEWVAVFQEKVREIASRKPCPR